jgi:hypothetical protein
VEKPRSVPSTETTTTPPINKVDSAKITNEIPEKKNENNKPSSETRN